MLVNCLPASDGWGRWARLEHPVPGRTRQLQSVRRYKHRVDQFGKLEVVNDAPLTRCVAVGNADQAYKVFGDRPIDSASLDRLGSHINPFWTPAGGIIRDLQELALVIRPHHRVGPARQRGKREILTVQSKTPRGTGRDETGQSVNGPRPSPPQRGTRTGRRRGLGDSSCEAPWEHLSVVGSDCGRPSVNPLGAPRRICFPTVGVAPTAHEYSSAVGPRSWVPTCRSEAGSSESPLFANVGTGDH